ncbi:hypothetical protein [Kutzneria buriramensis]|uniref:Uncharacterized protein n=1 Tax=Kutzneria buriramensis TaxID=1045776 RepID=A0A3E0GUV3_9PSEU|nr:hypothetical protein [Kutzneria buriramensis]REH25980.1 hypothetical protein BCF44_13519 [Kutzneria buriramensis]
MAVERSGWRELAARLVADASLIDSTMQASDVPDPAEAAEVAAAVAALTTGLRRLSIGVGRAYGGRLPDPVLAGYREAVKHLADAEPSLTLVAGELHRTMRDPWSDAPVSNPDPDAY